MNSHSNTVRRCVWGGRGWWRLRVQTHTQIFRSVTSTPVCLWISVSFSLMSVSLTPSHSVYLSVCLILFKCLSVSFSLSVCPSICLTPSHSLCLSVSIHVKLVCLTLSLSLSFFLSVCVTISLSVCLCFSLSIGLTLFLLLIVLSDWHSFWLSVSLCLSQTICLSAGVSHILSVWVTFYLSVCVSVYLSLSLAADVSYTLSVCLFVLFCFCVMLFICLSHSLSVCPPPRRGCWMCRWHTGITGETLSFSRMQESLTLCVNAGGWVCVFHLCLFNPCDTHIINVSLCRCKPHVISVFHICRVCAVSVADAWLIWAQSVWRATFLHQRTSANQSWRPWNSQWPIRYSKRRDTPTRTCRWCESSCRDADRYYSHRTTWGWGVMSTMGCIHEYYGMQVWIEEEALLC